MAQLRKLALFAFIFATFITTGVMAADKAGAPKPADDDGAPALYSIWSGLSAEASIAGMVTGNNTVAELTRRYGLGIGYTRQSDRLVYGALLRGDFGDGRTTATGGLRFGYALNTHVMPYAIGTMRWDAARFKIGDAQAALGAGAEVRLSDRITVFGEATRSVFGTGAMKDAAAETLFRGGARYKF
jgi:opacity protein-like surface antigen